MGFMMRSINNKNRHNDKNLTAAMQFTLEMTLLSHRTKIALAGTPILFVMEPPDEGLIYELDCESNLKLISQ